jgi:hypothetical protein
MDTTNLTISQGTDGSITHLTVIHHASLDLRWLALGIFTFAVLAWILRRIFWQKDSN